jgi:hypothetical protein
MISAEESALRQRGLNHARGSVWLEGVIISGQAAAIFERYLAGEIAIGNTAS